MPVMRSFPLISRSSGPSSNSGNAAPYFYFDSLSTPLTDEHIMLFAHIVEDIVVEFISGDTDTLICHNA